jgi:hypothetical protein
MGEGKTYGIVEACPSPASGISEPTATLTEEEARAIYRQGEEAVVFALLKLAKERAELAAQLGRQQGAKAATPSGMVAVYEKPSGHKRGKKPGQKEGHPGVRREPPARIHRREEHKLDRCLKCGKELPPEPTRTRVRIVEDIPERDPVATEHTIHASYCGNCKEIVEPIVPDALPGATIGHKLVALTAWLHYGLGQTLSQIVAVLNFHLQFQISEGGLVGMWRRLQEILYAWYQQIGEEAKNAAVLHADETGWRVAGVTHWLWCFTSNAVTYYLIDRSRGLPALKKFFTEAFEGTLITDFWGAYERVKAAFRQKCLAHLFRELEKVLVRNRSPGWMAFCKKLKRLLKDTLRLHEREDVSPEQYASRRTRFDVRLDEILAYPWEDPDARRLVKRMRKYREDLFRFLDDPNVSPDNNHAEREIRPAVIIRKNSLCNRSEEGAQVQAVLMSVYRTLKLRGADPIRTIASALREYVLTGALPPLPPAPASLG